MMQEFYIESITWDLDYNLDSDITLYIRHNGAAFRICYIAQKLADSSSLLEQHRNSYRVLYRDDPDLASPRTSELLGNPFKELMTQLALNLPKESAEYLHGYLYPPWFILEATVVKSKDSYVRPHFKTALSRQEFVRPGEYVNQFLQPHLSPLLASRLDTYSSREIQVIAYTPTPRIVPSKVLVDGTVYFFKPWVSGRVHGYYELQSYRKMLAATITKARICRLHGLIIDEDSDVLQHYPLDSDEEDYPGTRLVGLLLYYIENQGTLKDLAPWSDCTNEDRVRWFRQIHDSVECLHTAGVVWGDAKPENVLIDKEGDACLIDFGGSFTQGWVDKDKRETMEGDWQGVQKIKEWLVKWSDHPVTRAKREEPSSAETVRSTTQIQEGKRQV